MIIQSASQLEKYQKVVDTSLLIYRQLIDSLKPGTLPVKVDNLAKKLCDHHHVKPAFVGVSSKDKSYCYATCISVNDTVVHGVPSSTETLKKGDIVKIDFGIIKNSLFTDHCVTVVIGTLSKKTEKLITVAKNSVLNAVELAVTGRTIGDLGHIMHKTALDSRFDVLKQYTGHGIGHRLHEYPPIPAYGQPHTGDVLKQGQVICIEAQIVANSDQVYVADDGWSVKTKDHGYSAMFEYMVVVQDKKPLILTNDTLNWPLVV